MKKIIFLFSIFSFSQNMTDSSGLKQGNWELFFPYSEHILSEKGSFLDDKEEGIWLKYHEEGIIREVVNYKYGKIHGIRIVLDKKGKLIEQENYKNGKYEAPTRHHKVVLKRY